MTESLVPSIAYWAASCAEMVSGIIPVTELFWRETGSPAKLENKERGCIELTLGEGGGVLAHSKYTPACQFTWLAS